MKWVVGITFGLAGMLLMYQGLWIFDARTGLFGAAYGWIAMFCGAMMIVVGYAITRTREVSGCRTNER